MRYIVGVMSKKKTKRDYINEVRELNRTCFYLHREVRRMTYRNAAFLRQIRKLKQRSEQCEGVIDGQAGMRDGGLAPRHVEAAVEIWRKDWAAKRSPGNSREKAPVVPEIVGKLHSR